MELGQGRNDLDRHIEVGTDLSKLLVKGRLLQSDWYDCEGKPKHMHWCRKVLETYDSETDSVLLSEKGSRRLIDNLDKPDRVYSLEELYDDSLKMVWNVKEVDYELY
jgi:hypothetical protein